jgi:hypothetical protein
MKSGVLRAVTSVTSALAAVDVKELAGHEAGLQSV